MAGEDDPEDITMTQKEIAKFEKIKAQNARENPSNTKPIACPDCGCDYIIPLMKAYFTVSFAGNRMTIVWPSREGTNDTALVACPSCFIIYNVKDDGTLVKTDKFLKGKKA